MDDPNKEKRKLVVKIAESFLGTLYKYGVDIKEIPKFLDCSAFVQIVLFQALGIDIGRSTILQAKAGLVVMENDMLPGDLIFFRGSKGHFNDEWFPPEKYGLDFMIGHVAIYAGDGLVIHANGEKKVGKVVIEPLRKVKSARHRIVIIKRIIP